MYCRKTKYILGDLDDGIIHLYRADKVNQKVSVINDGSPSRTSQAFEIAHPYSQSFHC